MRALRWGLLLLWSLPLRATVEYGEDWLGAASWPEGWVAWGARHTRLEVDGQRVWREGFPCGVVTVLAGEGPPWAVLADGRLASLDPEAPAVWQVERQCWAAAAGEREEVWLLGPGGLRRLALRGPSSPEILECLPLPAGGSPRELRADGSRPWLRLGQDLWSLEAGTWRRRAVLPGEWRDWNLWRGRPLGLDARGSLRWLESGPAGELVLEAGFGRREGLPPGRRLLVQWGVLWLQGEGGVWWRWREGEPPRPCAPTLAGGDWLPGGADLLLREDGPLRSWWRLSGEDWRQVGWESRPPRLRDRLPRWTSSWRLRVEGALERRTPEGWRVCAHLGAPLALWPAGPGPLAMGGENLLALADEGGRLAEWRGAGLRCAAPLEDQVLVADGRALYTLDSSDEPLRVQHELLLPDIREVAASPLWAAVWAGGRIWLLDRRQPLAPRLVDWRPTPPGLQGLQLVEDCLVLLGPAPLELWTCAAGRWEDLPPALELPAARWACVRGADRLLTLDEEGRLRQFRLWGNRPVAQEWCRELPLVGRIRLALDSLRVTGEAGWMDLALPDLPGLAQADGPRLLQAGSRYRPSSSLARIRHQPGELWLEWSSTSATPAWLELYDLLGRRLERLAVPGPRFRLEMGRRAAGLYLISELDGAGRPIGAQPFPWRP